ncbi:Immunoglobulin domain protein [Aphelenchoides bicaudatus]|nr:Immunoglobulin domain protein [Aphelenchoides bicaudatus]
MSKCDCNGQRCNPITGDCLFGAASDQFQHLPDQDLLDISSFPLLKIYPLASAQYACENAQNSVKTRWFFDTRANLSAIDMFEPKFEDNSVSSLNPGEYLCQTRNPGQQQAAIRLSVPEYGEPPTARVENKHLHLKHGERRSIQCHTSGTPTPKTRWIGPDGYSLPMDAMDLGNGVLEISNARKFEHEGEYKCQAANLAGMVVDRISVSVGQQITIQITPDRPKIFVTVGSPLEIKCQAFGEPNPDVLWTHDAGPSRGDRPDDFVPVKISEEFILHKSVGFGNSGFYTCKAGNQYTTVTKDIYVEVMDTTRHEKISIVGGTSQKFLVGRPAQILCIPSGSALIDRLEWTKNDNKLSSGLEAFNEPGLLYFEAFQSTDEGVFECRAYHQDSLISSKSVFIYADEKRGSTEDTSSETLASLQIKLAKCKRKYAKSLKRKHNNKVKRHARRTKRRHHLI